MTASITASATDQQYVGKFDLSAAPAQRAPGDQGAGEANGFPFSQHIDPIQFDRLIRHGFGVNGAVGDGERVARVQNLLGLAVEDKPEVTLHDVPNHHAGMIVTTGLRRSRPWRR
jgi:hypothetical protein